MVKLNPLFIVPTVLIVGAPFAWVHADFRQVYGKLCEISLTIAATASLPGEAERKLKQVLNVNNNNDVTED